MKQLTKKTKIALASAGAGVLALAVALGIWQPWKTPSDIDEGPGQVQDALLPSVEQEEEEMELTLTVGGEEIPCTIFAGDGWKIYVPEEWKVDAGANGGSFSAVDDSGETLARVEVIRSIPAVYSGSYLAVSPQKLSDAEEWRLRSFYTGSEDGGWEVTCQGPVETWDDYQRLMTAVARTMTVGEEMPFSGMFPVPSEPDWQIENGNTILWMDKDGYAVTDQAKKFVETEMLAWDGERKANFTGTYRMDDLVWSGSYTCLPGREYVDIFRTSVWYEILPGREENILLGGDMSIQDGWLSEGAPLQVVVFHDGSSAEEVRILRANDTVPGTPDFAADLMG